MGNAEILNHKMAEKAEVKRTRPVCSRKSSRVAEKLQQKIKDKEYYEAHQTYRALFQRYKAQGKESDALELLYNGVLTLLEHGQWSSGTDLGMLLISHLKDNKTPFSSEWLEKIGKIFSQYVKISVPSDSNIGPVVFNVLPDIDNREALLRAALKWTSIVGEEDKWQYGHPDLHKMAANAYWEEKLYLEAKEHFLYAEDPQQFGIMLVELATRRGYRGEADLFIAQAVLQLLVLKNRSGGLSLFNSYTRKHPKFKSDNPPYLHHPLLNFIWFLLSACKDRNREVFECLKTNYSLCIARDPSFAEYLEKVGVAFFGPPNSNFQGQPTTSAAPQAMFGGSGGLLDGIISSISGMFGPSSGNTNPLGPPGTGGPNITHTTSAGPSSESSQSFTLPTGGTYTHDVGPIQIGPQGEISQTQHIHVGTQLHIPQAGAGPPGGGIHLNLTPNGAPFMFPPGPMPTGPPRRGIQTAPRGAPIGGHFGALHPLPPHTGRPPHNIHIGPPRPGHISVVGFRMEGIPLPGMAVPLTGGGQDGPVITSEQQRRYQQAAQTQQATPTDTNTSRPSDGPGPEDMELD